MISLATYRDYPSIIEVWEQSVRASHHFITEEYIQEIKTLLPKILPKVKIYSWRESDGTISGFVGVSAGKMEMLFIHPSKFRNGLGRQLAEFCIHSLSIVLVDVNDENQSAYRFYTNLGYQLIGRDEFDSTGKPHPILHLKWVPANLN